MVTQTNSDSYFEDKNGLKTVIVENEESLSLHKKNSIKKDDIGDNSDDSFHFANDDEYNEHELNNSFNDDDFDEEGYEEPTEEELKTLRRVQGPIPKRCYLIAIVELAERFAYYGLSTPFQNYMANGPDDNPKGLLQLNTTGATGLSYFFQFWCYLTPILGGYLADTFWGKYNTICVGVGLYIAGMFILFMTSIPSLTDRDKGLGGFVASIILIGLATGLIKSNLSVLIADQLPKRKPRVKTLKSGERVIEDSSITLQNVFMIFYLMINIGSLSVIATSELELHIGFWAAYLLPFCFFWLGVFVLVFGRHLYIKRPIGDKVISKSFRVLWILIKSRFNFDKAKPTMNPEKNYPWSDNFVEEIRRALAACKVFLFYPIYWTCYGQMINSFITQASMMELHGLPNDFLQCIDSIALIVFIPIVENFVYPTIRRWTPFRPITKIFWGFVFGSLSMVWAAVLQSIIYKTGPNYNHPLAAGTPNHVHIAWQVPAYVLIALSEIFASITGLEYAYSKAPATMKSFIMAIFLVTNAFGSAIGCALSPVAKDPDYTWLFTGLAVGCFISGCLFWICFRRYNAIEDAMNAIDYENDNMVVVSNEDKQSDEESNKKL